MKIVTCNPPFLRNYSRQSRSPCVAKSGTIYYAYYLAYAGVALEKNNFTVHHFDAIIEDLDFDQSLSKIEHISPSFVVVDTSTPSIYSDLNFCKALKAKLPSCTIAVVGTFPSKNLDELFKIRNQICGGFDIAIIGEYEEVCIDIANAIQQKSDFTHINGIALPIDDSSSEYIKTEKRELFKGEFLDNLPFVSEFYLRQFGENGIKKHFYASINWPYIQILTARGCPFKCTFCNIPSIGSYRTRSIESVADEFTYISKKLPFVKEVFIEDDTFPINRKRTIDLCNSLIEKNIKVTWSCNARVDTNKEALEAMKNAGCRLVCVGFESPSKKGLVGVIKNTNIDQQNKFMSLAREIDMKVNGCFILGLPGDDRESILNTINYSIQLSPNTAQFYPHMLYPGTGSFEWAEKNGYLKHKNWKNWITNEGFHSTPLKLENIEPEELIELTNFARFKFYTNYKYILRMIFQSIKSPKEFQRMLIAGKSFFPLLIKYITKYFKINYVK